MKLDTITFSQKIDTTECFFTCRKTGKMNVHKEYILSLILVLKRFCPQTVLLEMYKYHSLHGILLY